jgi:aspartyl-tRNA(Asn)/glutamyl-tRNA(Gln) amidotransferase subunit A
VATRSVPIALGSDTGGSIRQPASLCGVLGMKPTYGRVSRYGVVAFASSLDQIGPFTHTPSDMALAMSIISGKDERDSTSVDEPVPNFDAELKKSVKGLKIGIPKEYFVEGMDAEVKKAVLESANILKKLGAEIKDISLPNSEMALAVYYILAPSEASSNLARFDGMRYGFRNQEASNLIEQYGLNRRDGFGPEVKRRIMIGTYALSSGYYDAYYAKAQKVRTLIKRDFDAAFKTIDVVLTPVSPTPAFKIGEKANDPLTMYLSDIFTIPCNLAGIPGISVPCGFSSKGLPIGVQFYADLFKDDLLLRIANAYLAETNWHMRRPEMF